LAEELVAAVWTARETGIRLLIEEGERYQTRINAVLRSFVQTRQQSEHKIS
jgi:hypothetical protein